MFTTTQSLYLMYYNKDAQVDPNAPDAPVLHYTGDGHPTPYAYLVTGRLEPVMNFC